MREQLEAKGAQLLTVVNRCKIYKASSEKQEQVLVELKNARDIAMNKRGIA